MRVYFDNSATTRMHKEAADAVYRCMTENFGNPSSLHGIGYDAERAVKQARQQIAFLMGTNQKNIIFTGSGTESDNLAIYSAFKSSARMKGRKLIISAVEHPAVDVCASWMARGGVNVVRLPVDPYGIIRLGTLKEALDENTALVSVMHVNNEIGTIQPIEEIGRLISEENKAIGREIIFHSDAVQSFAKFPIDIENGDFRKVDLISFSAHKIHGPKGVGALYAAKPERLAPVIRGGGQESGIRSGTENVAGIAGFGVAARQVGSDMQAHARRAGECRQRLMDGIMRIVPEARVNGPVTHSDIGNAGCCSPYILSVSFPGIKGEVLVHALEERGIYVSTGAACSARQRETGKSNTVLTAIGLTREQADGTVRFSFSRYNTLPEVDYVLENLDIAIERIRR